MKSMIQELWYGNIIPQEDELTNTRDMKECLKHISECHGDLEKSMTNEQKEIFQKCQNHWCKYASHAEEAVFTYAFKLGMQIAIEALTE